MQTNPKYHKGRKRVNVALQGGGAHGAFTWGVLECLMSDGRLFIDGLSGTSAGAMNAVVFTDGFVRGRQRGAIDALASFWQRVSEESLLPMSGVRALASTMHGWNVDNTLGFQMVDTVMRMFSPYDLNPLNLHPLREILLESVDFANLQQHLEIKLFIAATNVRNCKLKVFHTPEISVDAVLASACLPLLFRAVEVDGESYWDGGYLANPPVVPLIHGCISKDVIVVQVNPMNRPEVPTTARQILNRLNEISFNSALVREMNGVATVSRLLDEDRIDPQHHRFSTVNFHLIEAERDMSQLGSSSKFNADWHFLCDLHALGYRAAKNWLDQHFDAIGYRSTLDLFNTYE